MAEQKVQIGAEELKDLLKTAIEEAKKPVVTEEEQKRREDMIADRRASAEEAKKIIDAEEAKQRACSHRRFENNQSRCVYVDVGTGPGQKFLICQFCRAIIRPEEKPEMFNALMQSQMPAVF